MKYYYVHGFNSYKGGNTAKGLSKYFPITEQYYESDRKFRDNLESLKTQVDPHGEAIFIGTSLGGFYASQLACACDVEARALLINPAVRPENTLRKYVGLELNNFATGKPMTLTLAVAESYKERMDEAVEKSSGIPKIILLSDNDTVLDATEARDYWQGHGDIRTISGGHQIRDFEMLAKCIRELEQCPSAVLWKSEFKAQSA